MSKGKLLKSVPILSYQFRIEFLIRINSKPIANVNVLHITKNIGDGNWDQIPRVSLTKEGYLSICIWSNCEGVLIVESPSGSGPYVVLGGWYLFVIKQYFDDQNIITKIEMQGNEIHSSVNTSPQYFTDVSVYTSEPSDVNTFTADLGILQNLKILSEYIQRWIWTDVQCVQYKVYDKILDFRSHWRTLCRNSRNKIGQPSSDNSQMGVRVNYHGKFI